MTQFLAEEDHYTYSREKLMARLIAGLGGRAVEELIFGPERVTTGAEDDFRADTELAWKMVTHWGMSERMGVMFVEGREFAGSPALNFRQDDVPFARSRTLVVGPDGRLLLNGGDLPARQCRYSAQDGISGVANSTSRATVIDLEVQRLLSEGYQTAKALLHEHNDQLNKLAYALMEHEQLDRAAFEQLVGA